MKETERHWHRGATSSMSGDSEVVILTNSRFKRVTERLLRGMSDFLRGMD